MGKLIYSMLTSADGYTEDADGSFGWGAPESEELHGYINERFAGVGTYLYGRRMYDTMVFWETAHIGDHPQALRDFARQWQAVEKIVFSQTLDQPRSARTRIERAFDPDAIRQLKARTSHDLTVDGPELAAQALKAGLVDEIEPIVSPVIVGNGKRFLPEGLRLELETIACRPFGNGMVSIRYAVRN